MGIVVSNVGLGDVIEVPKAEAGKVIEAFAFQAADPRFSKGIGDGSLEGRFDDVTFTASKKRIEPFREFGVPIVDQEPEIEPLILQPHAQIPGLLLDPFMWDEYEAFATRDLSEFDIAYLFIDGVAERLHPGQKKDAVLCAWGIDFGGKKHLLHLSPGFKEDTASVEAFLQDLKRRGLGDPLLVTTDGAGGLIAAVDQVLPRSERQRCLVHKMRNLESKVPEDQWPAFKEYAKACYQAPSMEVARSLKDGVVGQFEKSLPAAAKCFLEDFEACIAHLRFPLRHRRGIRTTNMLERLFGEERRRTKVIPHAFGEKPLLKLMFAATIRASNRWKGIKMTAFDRQQLQAIRTELDQAFEARNQPPTKRATRSRISSKTGT